MQTYYFAGSAVKAEPFQQLYSKMINKRQNHNWFHSFLFVVQVNVSCLNCIWMDLEKESAKNKTMEIMYLTGFLPHSWWLLFLDAKECAFHKKVCKCSSVYIET